MEVEFINNSTQNIISFLITFSGILLFFIAIINPKLIIAEILQEKYFKNMTRYVRLKRLIYFVFGGVMIILPLLQLFSVINRTTYGIALIITSLLLALSDYCVKQLCILSKE